MILSEFIELAKTDFDKCLQILQSKNNDYADVKDVFSNFKYSGDYAGVDASVACRVLIGTKMARLKELLSSNKEIKNESIDDTLADSINYLEILRGILKEKEGETK
jgi:hypothetical protein